MFSTAEIATPTFKAWSRTVARKGAICTSCKGTHYEAMFKMCKTCRATSLERLTEWRANQKKQHLCHDCVEAWDEGSISRCTHHLEMEREYQSRMRGKQIKAGLCTYGRCQNRPLHAKRGEGGFCEKHLQLLAERRAQRVEQDEQPKRRKAA